MNCKQLRRSKKIAWLFFPYYRLKAIWDVRKNKSEIGEFFDDSCGIIHIGAHHAEERFDYAKLKKKVLWIEANPSHEAKITANLRGFPRQKVIIGLLGSTELAQRRFFISNNSGSSSSVFDFAEHTELWPEVSMINICELPQTTLPQLLQKHRIKISEYDSLVLDIQGAELDVLKGIPDLKKYFKKIQLEAADFKIYDGAPLKKEIDQYLFSKGFKNLESKAFKTNKLQTKKCMNCKYTLIKDDQS